MHSQIYFGYPWWIDYGHLVFALPFLLVLVLGCVRKWHKALLTVLGLVALWALVAWVIVRFGFDINGRATLPTEAFLRSGSGKVLDMGAGTGRSTMMVLESRPHSTVVALDQFGESYEEHFGRSKDGDTAVDEGRARLMSNLRAAGIEQRASIQAGDMRQMPLGDGLFDAIVSSYAIDHLGREDIRKSLREANRVLKPGGEFLLLVIAKDRWLTFTFGPLMLHARLLPSDFWERSLQEAGFEIVESGKRPGTNYILARKI